MPIMPSAIVLIVCKTVALPFSSELEEHNAKMTGYEKRELVVEHGKLQCRRIEYPLMPVDHVGTGGSPSLPASTPTPLTRHQCQMAAPFVGARWDEQNKHQSYRVWSASCPTPIMDTRTGQIIAWKMPDCGNRDTVVCEVDTAI